MCADPAITWTKWRLYKMSQATSLSALTKTDGTLRSPPLHTALHQNTRTHVLFYRLGKGFFTCSWCTAVKSTENVIVTVTPDSVAAEWVCSLTVDLHRAVFHDRGWVCPASCQSTRLTLCWAVEKAGAHCMPTDILHSFSLRGPSENSATRKKMSLTYNKIIHLNTRNMRFFSHYITSVAYPP